MQAAEHGRGWIGHLVTRFHLQAWVNRNAPKLQSLGTTLAKPALTAGKGAASLLAAHPPVKLDLVLDAGEFQWVDQVRARSRRGGLGYRGVEPGRAVRAELDQEPAA